MNPDLGKEIGVVEYMYIAKLAAIHLQYQVTCTHVL